MIRLRQSSGLGLAAMRCVPALVFLLACSSDSIPEQPGWAYGGFGSDHASGVVENGQGKLVVIGTTNSFGARDDDVYLFEIDSVGHLLWQRAFGGSGTEQGLGIAQCGDGGYAAVGATNSFPEPDNRAVYLVRVDSSGILQWQSIIFYDAMASSDIGRCVRQTADGGFLIGGDYSSFGQTSAYIIKTDASGYATSKRLLQGEGEATSHSVVETGDGNYVLAGSTWTFDRPHPDIYLVEVNPLGDTLWSRTISDTLSSYAEAIVRTDSGCYLVSGEAGTTSGGVFRGRLFTVCVDSAGTPIWRTTFGDSIWDPGGLSTSIAGCPDGGCVVACEYSIYRLTRTGELVWQVAFGGVTKSASAMRNMDYAVAGDRRDDAYILMVNADGTPIQ